MRPATMHDCRAIEELQQAQQESEATAGDQVLGEGSVEAAPEATDEHQSPAHEAEANAPEGGFESTVVAEWEEESRCYSMVELYSLKFRAR